MVKDDLKLLKDVLQKFEKLSNELEKKIIGQKEIIELLIAKGADLNAKGHNKWTPLDWAIDHKRSEFADLLRNHGGKTAEELKAAGH